MNFMKPRCTVHNEPALLYRRFIGLEKSTTQGMVYVTLDTNNTEKYWIFSKEDKKFVQVPTKVGYQQVVNVGSEVFVYLDNKYRYTNNAWQVAGEGDFTLLDVKFNDVAKYQTHKYYYAGSFDWLIKGGQEGVSSQPIKGAIMPLDALNIVHYNDDIMLQRDDLIVINDRLFCVEDTEVVQKRMPRAFNVYSATLNNLL